MQNANNRDNAPPRPEVGQIIRPRDGIIATVPAYEGGGYMTVLQDTPEGWVATSDQKGLEARRIRGMTCFLRDKPGDKDIRLTRVGEKSAFAVVAINDKKGKRNRRHKHH